METINICVRQAIFESILSKVIVVTLFISQKCENYLASFVLKLKIRSDSSGILWTCNCFRIWECLWPGNVTEMIVLFVASL